MAPAKINDQPLVAVNNPTVLQLLAVDGEDQVLPILKLQAAVDVEDHQVLPILKLQAAVDGEDHQVLPILKLQVAVDGEDHQVLPILKLQVEEQDHLPNRIFRLFLSQRCCSFPE
jgi:hypothetical protein